jgi:hypothetical protein
MAGQTPLDPPTHDHLHIAPGALTFVAKRVSGGPGAATVGVPPYTIAELAAAEKMRVTPGIDPAAREWLFLASFMLAPIHARAVAPTLSDAGLAELAVQLLGDAGSRINPVRRHFLARDVDLADGPDLADYAADVGEIVRAVGVPVERTDRLLRAPLARSIPRDFWPDLWHDDVAAAVASWAGATPPRESWIRILVAPKWTSHLAGVLPVFGTRARRMR